MEVLILSQSINGGGGGGIDTSGVRWGGLISQQVWGGGELVPVGVSITLGVTVTLGWERGV